MGLVPLSDLVNVVTVGEVYCGCAVLEPSVCAASGGRDGAAGGGCSGSLPP